MSLPPVIESYRDEYEIHLSGRKLARHTIKFYMRYLNLFLAWLNENHPDIEEPAGVRSLICSEYLGTYRERGQKDATIRARGLGIQLWFKYLCSQPDIAEVTANPMDKVELPTPTPPRVEIVDDDVIRAVLATCERGTFNGARDEAIIRLLFDTGLRRFEVAGALVENLDNKRREIKVYGKGGKWRVATYSSKTALSLVKYLRLRAKHAAADDPHLFLSMRSSKHTGSRVLTGSGIYSMLDTRRIAAGIAEHVRPHRFRHTWAHGMKEDGASDEVIEIMGGWSKGSKEVRRYGAAVAEQRALNAARGLTRGDRI